MSDWMKFKDDDYDEEDDFSDHGRDSEEERKIESG